MRNTIENIIIVIIVLVGSGLVNTYIMQTSIREMQPVLIRSVEVPKTQYQTKVRKLKTSDGSAVRLSIKPPERDTSEVVPQENILTRKQRRKARRQERKRARLLKKLNK